MINENVICYTPVNNASTAGALACICVTDVGNAYVQVFDATEEAAAEEAEPPQAVRAAAAAAAPQTARNERRVIFFMMFSSKITPELLPGLDFPFLCFPLERLDYSAPPFRLRP